MARPIPLSLPAPLTRATCCIFSIYTQPVITNLRLIYLNTAYKTSIDLFVITKDYVRKFERGVQHDCQWHQPIRRRSLRPARAPALYRAQPQVRAPGRTRTQLAVGRRADALDGRLVNPGAAVRRTSQGRALL